MRRIGGEELYLHEGLHVREVEVATRALEAPCHRVLRARRQLRRVKGAEVEAESSDTELGVESPVGVRADAAEAQRTTTSQRHPGEAKRRMASKKTRDVARREEEKKRCVA
jgi:hypothetical protein